MTTIDRHPDVVLTIPETAQALGASEPTVQRDWAFARSWLKDAIDATPD